MALLRIASTQQPPSATSSCPRVSHVGERERRGEGLGGAAGADQVHQHGRPVLLALPRVPLRGGCVHVAVHDSGGSGSLSVAAGHHRGQLPHHKPGHPELADSRLLADGGHVHLVLRPLRRHLRLPDSHDRRLVLVRRLVDGCWCQRLLELYSLHLCADSAGHRARDAVAQRLGLAGCNVPAWQEEVHGLLAVRGDGAEWVHHHGGLCGAVLAACLVALDVVVYGYLLFYLWRAGHGGHPADSLGG